LQQTTIMDKLNPKDISLSIYANSTQIGLDKLKFRSAVLPYLKKAVEEIFAQLNDLQKAGIKSGFPVSKIPFVLFPKVKEALGCFDKKHNSDFLVLHYKHTPIGIIKEDIPASIPICPECGIMVKTQKAESPKLMGVKKYVKFFFKSAYTPLFDESVWVCPEHGIQNQFDILNM
jgi:hypothetical protein